MEAAMLFRGKTVEVYREDISDDIIFAAELIGVQVYAEDKHIGNITDVLDYPGNKVYVVKGEHEYMIPAVKEFIEELNPAAGYVKVRLIEGMRTDAD